ncbi:MAG: hypothetical protein ACI8S6_001484 [Myxococcota bacterium]|jgi:hypothetical protein
MFFIIALACNRREPYYPPPDTDTETAETDTDTDTQVGDSAEEEAWSAWDDPEWWIEPGPFAPLVDMSNAPTRPHWEAWITTSPDLVTWTKGRPFAFDFSSLDLLVLPQGIIVGGSLTPNPDLNLKAPFENVFVLVSTDLQTWGSHQLPITDAAQPMIIDPSMHMTPDGRLQLVYFGSGLDVDSEKLPDDYPNPHAIYNAWWSGDRFVQESPEPLLEADYVVDPSGCYHDGTHYMMGTRRYGELYFSSRDADDTEAEYTPVVEGSAWGGVQVPYCYNQEEEPIFVAQYGGGYGAPLVRRLDEQGQPGPEESLFKIEERGYDGCTSPVLGYFDDEYILICVSWIE